MLSGCRSYPRLKVCQACESYVYNKRLLVTAETLVFGGVGVDLIMRLQSTFQRVERGAKQQFIMKKLILASVGSDLKSICEGHLPTVFPSAAIFFLNLYYVA